MPGPLPTIRLRLPCHTEEEFQNKYGETLGLDGVFVPSLNLRPLGTHVRLMLELRDGRPALTAEGVVAKHAVPGTRPGMTVQLVSVEPGGFQIQLAPPPPPVPALADEFPTGEVNLPPPPAEPRTTPYVATTPEPASAPPVPDLAPPVLPEDLAPEARRVTAPEVPAPKLPAPSYSMPPPSLADSSTEDYTQPYPQDLSALLPQLTPLTGSPEVEEPKTGEEDVDLGDFEAPVLPPDEGPTRAAPPPVASAEPPTTIDNTSRRKPAPPPQPQAGPAWGAGEPDDDLKPYRTRLDRPRVSEEPAPPPPPPASTGSEPPATWLWVVFGTLVLACIVVIYALVKT